MKITRYTKLRAQKAAEAARRERQEQDERRLKRALRAVKFTGVANDSQKIAALERYLASLQDLRAYMVSKYGEARELWRIDIEMKRTLEQITRLQITSNKERLMG